MLLPPEKRPLIQMEGSKTLKPLMEYVNGQQGGQRLNDRMGRKKNIHQRIP